MAVPDLFQYFCGSTLLISLIAISVIVFFRKEKTSQLAGFFALKFIIVYGLAFTAVVLRLRMSAPIWLATYSVIEFSLFFMIILRFRDLYNKSSRLPWLFAGCDFIRWGTLFSLAAKSLFSYSLNIDQMALISSGIMVYSIVLALFGLFLGVIRRKKVQVV